MVGVSSLARSTLTLRLSSSWSTGLWTQSIKGVGRTRQDTKQRTQISVCAFYVKMASYNKPSNQIRQKTLRILDPSLKGRYHRHGIYEMGLIYVHTRVKGQDSHLLALEIGFNKFICIWYRHTRMFSWMILDLTDGSLYSLDWTTGLDHWTGILDWNTGLDYWTHLWPPK